jgi:hypothetical protein
MTWRTRLAVIVGALPRADVEETECALRLNVLIHIVVTTDIARKRLLRMFCSMMACLMAVSGCVSSRPMALEETIDMFYRAEKSRDWKTVWSFAHPMLKQEAGPYYEFSKVADAREDNPISWRILRIEEIRDPHLIRNLRGTRAVKVPMDVTVYYRDSNETSKAEDQTDYWVQQHNGRWLWYYRGGPSD